MPWTLRWKRGDGPPVEAVGLAPGAFAGLDRNALGRIAVPEGNRRVALEDLAEIRGEEGDGPLTFEGDLRRLAGIGAGLESGRILVRGDAGPRLGAGMSGGSIEVLGSAGNWLGAGMTGGSIRVRGDAGDGVGAARPGLAVGMREGSILVDGSVGADAGLGMRRGLIAVGGRSGPGLGRGIVAGSIFAFGTVGSGVGAGMRRGSIVLLGGDDPDGGLLPTFHPSGTFRPPVLTIYLRHLRDLGFAVPEAAFAAGVRRYNGDLVEGGRGEILVVGRDRGES